MKRSRKKKVVKRQQSDPYRLAQAKAIRSANIARQRILKEESEAAKGNPVVSSPTPFIESLRSTAAPVPSEESDGSHLNYFLKQEDLDKSLRYSKWLTEPLPESYQSIGAEERLAERVTQHQSQHENAEKALSSITSLENASSKDRQRVNIQRCIEEFGRHKTDGVLPPGLKSKHNLHVDTEADKILKQRVGADTGSSEVQIAILTSKITVLASNLRNKDKSNKRRLRMMVHKRQKLMAYLRRQDRGGPRWQNVVEKLGLNDAMWKGEISL
jgi:ribosomal protein S15